MVREKKMEPQQENRKTCKTTVGQLHSQPIEKLLQKQKSIYLTRIYAYRYDFEAGVEFPNFNIMFYEENELFPPENLQKTQGYKEGKKPKNMVSISPKKKEE